MRGHATAEQYAQRATVYANAMRAVDPSLRLIAVGAGIFPGSDDWNSAVLRIAGPYVNFLAIHDYTSRSQNSSTPNPRNAMMARAGEFERNYMHIGDLAKQYAPGRNIRLIVNEWNLFYSAETLQSMEGAVYAARMMNGFERDGEVVEANSISDLLNGWVGGVIQASRDRIYRTAQFHALKMWNDHLGTQRVHTGIASPDLSAGVEAVDATAAMSEDKSTLYVKLSNARQEGPVQTTIDVHGFHFQQSAQLDLLSASTPQARNTFASPNLLQPHTEALSCKQVCTFTLPADSVAVLTLKK